MPKKTITKPVRLTPEEGKLISDLWEITGDTIDIIAVKVGRHRSSVQKFITRNGLVKGSKSTPIPPKEEAAKAEVGDEVLRLVRIKETQDESYRIATFVQKLIGAEMQRARTAGESQAKGFDTFRALLLAGQGLKTAQAVRERALGMDKEKEPGEKVLPTLGVHVVSEAEIKKIQEQNKVTNVIDQAIQDLDADMNSDT